jgi:hypothetical protein
LFLKLFRAAQQSIFYKRKYYFIYFRLQDKNHAPFKLNGQSCTAFGLLKAPELQRLSVTIEVLRVGVTIVEVFFTKENIISYRSNKIAFSN